MTYGDFKDLPRRAASDTVLCDEAFDITKKSKCDGYQRGLASVIYYLFDKKSAAHKEIGLNSNLEFFLRTSN